MSLMINGKLHSDWLDAEIMDGEFIRQDSQFRNWVTIDGTAGPSGKDGFKAEENRYHLYVSHACPWAHRTLIFRKLKALDDIISVSVVHPHMGKKGWRFEDYPGATGDTLYNHEFMHQLYTQAEPHYSGIVTVPVLWDKQRETIVNNESSEIIRMLNSSFNQWTDNHYDYYPAALREQIDQINKRIYNNINNGVYRTGFAATQKAYEKNYSRLFDALDYIEELLGKQQYLTGTQITEADWRLFTTLIRFDAVYVGHFKCNKRRIKDYSNLYNFMLELYQWPGIAETVNFEHIKQHYYYSHTEINPTQIVPKGPEQDLTKSHNRSHLQQNL